MVRVIRTILHENYVCRPGESNNDIALLYLEEEIDLQKYTPVCLPVTTDDFTGRTASIYGTF